MYCVHWYHVWLSEPYGVDCDEFCLAMSTETFGDFVDSLGLSLLEFGTAGIFDSLFLQNLDMLASIANAFACSEEGTVSLLLSHLSILDSLAGSED